MRKPIVFMFSGQGSHYYQMGRELFEQLPLFEYWMRTADNLYQDLIGLSLIHELYQDTHKRSDPFTRTLFTHPAIFMVEHALGHVLIAHDIKPDYILGTSLGEFVAAVFAGILSFESAFTAVIKQAQVLEAQCSAGGMLAILGPLALYQDNAFLQEKSELAACNFHSHFILSGRPHALTAIETYLAAQSIMFQRLAVSHGFHSSLIDAGAADYRYFIHQQSLRTPALPFISCAHAERLTDLSPNHFWDSIRLPIQFQATLEKLEKENHYYYIDVGPSGTLSTFVKYNLSANSPSQPLTFLTPFGQDTKNLAKIIADLTL